MEKGKMASIFTLLLLTYVAAADGLELPDPNRMLQCPPSLTSYMKFRRPDEKIYGYQKVFYMCHPFMPWSDGLRLCTWPPERLEWDDPGPLVLTSPDTISFRSEEIKVAVKNGREGGPFPRRFIPGIYLFNRVLPDGKTSFEWFSMHSRSFLKKTETNLHTLPDHETWEDVLSLTNRFSEIESSFSTDTGLHFKCRNETSYINCQVIRDHSELFQRQKLDQAVQPFSLSLRDVSRGVVGVIDGRAFYSLEQHGSFRPLKPVPFTDDGRVVSVAVTSNLGDADMLIVTLEAQGAFKTRYMPAGVFSSFVERPGYVFPVHKMDEIIPRRAQLAGQDLEVQMDRMRLSCTSKALDTKLLLGPPTEQRIALPEEPRAPVVSCDGGECLAVVQMRQNNRRILILYTSKKLNYQWVQVQVFDMELSRLLLAASEIRISRETTSMWLVMGRHNADLSFLRVTVQFGGATVSWLGFLDALPEPANSCDVDAGKRTVVCASTSGQLHLLSVDLEGMLYSSQVFPLEKTFQGKVRNVRIIGSGQVAVVTTEKEEFKLYKVRGGPLGGGLIEQQEYYRRHENYAVLSVNGEPELAKMDDRTINSGNEAFEVYLGDAWMTEYKSFTLTTSIAMFWLRLNTGAFLPMLVSAKARTIGARFFGVAFEPTDFEDCQIVSPDLDAGDAFLEICASKNATYTFSSRVFRADIDTFVESFDEEVIDEGYDEEDDEKEEKEQNPADSSIEIILAAVLTTTVAVGSILVSIVKGKSPKSSEKEDNVHDNTSTTIVSPASDHPGENL